MTTLKNLFKTENYSLNCFKGIEDDEFIQNEIPELVSICKSNIDRYFENRFGGFKPKKLFLNKLRVKRKVFGKNHNIYNVTIGFTTSKVAPLASMLNRFVTQSFMYDETEGKWILCKVKEI